MNEVTKVVWVPLTDEEAESLIRCSRNPHDLDKFYDSLKMCKPVVVTSDCPPEEVIKIVKREVNWLDESDETRETLVAWVDQYGMETTNDEESNSQEFQYGRD